MWDMQPANDCREIFSGDLYRIISPEDQNFLISPAAIFKLLLTATFGAIPLIADQSLWDLSIKHIDKEHLTEEANKEGIFDLGFAVEIRRRLQLEMSNWIKPENLREFFKNDFTELKENVRVENFIVADGKLEFSETYRQLAKEFFNVKLLKKTLDDEKRLIESKFEILLSENNLDIFGNSHFKFNFQAPFFTNDEGNFEAIGKFNFNELTIWSSLEFRTDVLEVPLAPVNDISVSMLIFISNDFSTLLKQSIGRNYTDFNEISKQLEPRTVHVKLPKFEVNMQANLRAHFAEHSYRGLRDFFNKPIIMNRLFKNADNVEIEIGQFYSKTSLEINGPESGNADAHSAKADLIFDATEKSFFYVIKSEKIVYIMGQFFKSE